MYQINANEIVGRKIYETRIAQGISQETLSDRISDACGIHISADMIGRYERGERRIDQDSLVAIAIGLDCSLQNLQDTIDPRNGESPSASKMMKRLTPEEHRILRYIASDWRGDRRALVIADGVYAALPEDYAASAMIGLMHEMARALSDGVLDVSKLPDGIPYLESKIGALCEKNGVKL